jgi:hypothetical protein
MDISHSETLKKNAKVGKMKLLTNVKIVCHACERENKRKK